MTTEITARDKLLLYVVGMLAFIFFFVQFMLTPALEASDEAAASLAEAQQAQIAMQETIALAGTNAVPWFVAGDPSYARSIQVDYLNGQETPTIRRSEVPGRLGFVWDIWLDWGITAVDFRGIAKNPGTTI